MSFHPKTFSLEEFRSDILVHKDIPCLASALFAHCQTVKDLHAVWAKALAEKSFKRNHLILISAEASKHGIILKVPPKSSIWQKIKFLLTK